MNSLVQTLFMNPAFRRGIYAWAPPAAADAQDSVAQGIRNQRIYRRQRKQELAKLKTTLEELLKKPCKCGKQH